MDESDEQPDQADVESLAPSIPIARVEAVALSVTHPTLPLVVHDASWHTTWAIVRDWVTCTQKLYSTQTQSTLKFLQG